MTCSEIAQLLSRYLTGDLSPVEAEAFEEHAGSCDGCAVLVEGQTRLPVTLPVELPPPTALRPAVLGAVARHRGRGRVVRWLAPPAIAAALVLGFALTTVRDKAAMMREREMTSPHAFAESRSFPEFERLSRARQELARELDRAAPAGRPGLERALRLVERHHEALVRIVEEFET